MPSVPPGAWLGLLGGGQLGRMFCMAAQSLGYTRRRARSGQRRVPRAAWRTATSPPTTSMRAALDELARIAAAATTEFENVPAAALDFLARTARVTPAAASVAIAQDRISEKMFLSGNGFAVAPFAILRSEDDVAQVDAAAAARHRQERALRLRRQGPGRACDARGRCARRGARCAASHACSSEGSRSRARYR